MTCEVCGKWAPPDPETGYDADTICPACQAAADEADALREEQDHDFTIAAAMRRYGGGFVTLLGKLWQAADDDNRARLKAAFPEYWRKYAALTEQAGDEDRT